MTAAPAAFLPEPFDYLLVQAEEHSDMPLAGLSDLAGHFYTAHQNAPGGLSVEIGTRRGGSAWLCLKILEHLYPAAVRPMLLTVDPYGGKPYQGGDMTLKDAYGDADYLRAKRLLMSFPNHAHYFMEGVTFFHFLGGTSYWQHQERRRVDQLTFALLDGDHDHETVENEFNLAWKRLAPGGSILIDNVDKDPGTIGALQRLVAGGTPHMNRMCFTRARA